MFAALFASAGCGQNLSHPDLTNDPNDQKLTCLPNLDGRIDIEEMPTVTQGEAAFWVSPDGGTIDRKGRVNSEGRTLWDWSQTTPNDELVHYGASEPNRAWYASSFPTGDLAAPLDSLRTIVGILHRDDHALVLLGLASTEADPPLGRTLLVYDPPIPLYIFPIELGSEWTSVGKVEDGLLYGLPYRGTDTYSFNSDAVGEIALPDLSFTQAHRLNIHSTVKPDGGLAVSSRSVAFLFECFGEVARATSTPGESDDDFTTASEIRRFSIE